MNAQTQERSAELTVEDKAVEEMISADGIHLLEEYAMSHLWDFAERLEKEYGRRLKKKGLEQVDYYAIAERFTLSLFARLRDRHGE